MLHEKIDIDFDVFKEITARRKSSETSPNDVLRELFNLNPIQSKQTIINPPKHSLSWVVKNVEFPEDTDFRAAYKGKQYFAKVRNGGLLYDGKLYHAPSKAAMAITNSSVNGWVFWECKLPNSSSWKYIDKLR